MTFRRILVPSFSRSSSSSLGRLDFEDEGTTIPKKKIVMQKSNLCCGDEFKSFRAGDLSPAPYRVGPGSISGQSMHVFCWTK